MPGVGTLDHLPPDAVLDQRPVPAAVERASDRPDIVRGGRPDGVEVDAQRGRGVDGDDAPVSAVGLKAEGTVSATAPRGADHPCPPAAPGGNPVQRGAVQARRSGDRRPAPPVGSKDQWLRWAARPGRSTHRPHDAGSGRVDRVQPVARAAEPRQPRDSPAIAIPVLHQRSIDPPGVAVADRPHVSRGCRRHGHEGVVPGSRIRAGRDGPPPPVPMQDQRPGRPARGPGQPNCPCVRSGQGHDGVQEAASGGPIGAWDRAPGSPLPALHQCPGWTSWRQGDANRPHVPRRGGGHAEQLVRLTSAGRTRLHVPPAVAAGGGTRASRARRQRRQG